MRRQAFGGSLQATKEGDTVNLATLEALASEAMQMPLIIPEARLLAEKLEAAQQLGMTVRRLLRLESGDPAREPELQTGRGHRRRSAGARPADDVTLKVPAFSGSGLKCLAWHAAFTNTQTHLDMRADECPDRLLPSKWGCNVFAHDKAVLSALHIEYCHGPQERSFIREPPLIRMLQKINVIQSASLHICCWHDPGRALAAGT